MKKLFLMSLVFLSTMLAAQKPVEIKLWPNGAPNTNNMTQQIENGPLYVAEPTLTVYPAKEGNGMAIVACPGGGYTHLAMNHEGHDLATGSTVRVSPMPYLPTACQMETTKSR